MRKVAYDQNVKQVHLLLIAAPVPSMAVSGCASLELDNTGVFPTLVSSVFAVLICALVVFAVMRGSRKRGTKSDKEIGQQGLKSLTAQVATVSAKGDREIGNIVAKAIDGIGEDGVITVEEAKGIETTLDFVEGMQFGQVPYFATYSESMEFNLDNACVLIHERKISSLKDMLPLLEKVAKTSRPLLIITEEVEGEALAALAVNELHGTPNIVAVKAPEFGDCHKAVMEDIAILTGGQCITEDLVTSLERIELDQLGEAKTIKIGKEDTVIVEGGGGSEAVHGRVGQIRRQIEETTSDYDREKLIERLVRLAGGVAVINVGAATETEMKEKKALVEDALYATRAAVREGIVVESESGNK